MEPLARALIGIGAVFAAVLTLVLLVEGPLVLRGRRVVARVIGIQGACPLNYKVGDRFVIKENGQVQPRVCDYAQRAMARAAQNVRGGVALPGTPCCPVLEHMLMFEMMPEQLPQKA